MGMSSRSKDGASMTDINVTPLVGVVLVLLILMMITAPSMANKSIPLELPKAKSGESGSARKRLVVSVDESGALFLDTLRVDDAAVRKHAREAAARGPQVTSVLAADGRVGHEAVVHALELLRGERVSKIAIVVRTPSERP